LYIKTERSVPATHANVEHRTSNVERRMNVFCLFKNRFREAIPSFVIRYSIFDILRFSILRFVCFKIDKAQRHQYSMFDVGRSMFDVQSVHYPGQAEFHTKFHIRFQDLANRLPDTPGPDRTLYESGR
jgi:hypothetical protein